MTHSHSSASENHSQLSSCLRNTLTVKPLLQKITHCYPPASYSLSGSISCVTQSLRIKALPQKHTNSHPPASETHSQLNPCFIHSLSFISCLIFMPLPHTFNQHHHPASENHSQTSPCLTQSHSCDTHTGPPALALCLHFIYFIILFTHTHSWSSPSLTQLRVWGCLALFGCRDSALGFMSLRAPGRDPPRPVIPGAELRQGDD